MFLHQRVYRLMLMLSTKWTMVSASYGYVRRNCRSCCCVWSVRVLATSNTVNLYASNSTLHFYTNKIESERVRERGKKIWYNPLVAWSHIKHVSYFIVNGDGGGGGRVLQLNVPHKQRIMNERIAHNNKKIWYARSNDRPKWRAKHEKRQNNLHYLLTKQRQ